MKGIFFTEFLDMVDQSFSQEMTESILNSCNLTSNGCYTTVGYYDYEELLALMVALSKHTGTPVAQIGINLGARLFQYLKAQFEDELTKLTDLFQFLFNLEKFIHMDLKKLYPESFVPSLSCHQLDSKQIELTYQSRGPFVDLLEGLIIASSKFFNTNASIERTYANVTNTHAIFLVSKTA